jgi:hypothetical protein
MAELAVPRLVLESDPAIHESVPPSLASWRMTSARHRPADSFAGHGRDTSLKAQVAEVQQRLALAMAATAARPVEGGEIAHIHPQTLNRLDV